MVSPKPAMALKRLDDDIEVQPVQDAANNESVLPGGEPTSHANPSDRAESKAPESKDHESKDPESKDLQSKDLESGDAELADTETVTNREKSAGIKVPTQGATYRGVQSKLEMQPVAGPIFGRSARGRQPLFRLRALTRKTETQHGTSRSLPRPPADRVAEQVPLQPSNDGWVSRGEALNEVRRLPSSSSPIPLGDPGSASSTRPAAPKYATTPEPSLEPRVIAPRGPVASTLEFKVSQNAIDPPSIMESDEIESRDAIDSPRAETAAQKPRPAQNSVLRLRKQAESVLVGPGTASESKSAMAKTKDQVKDSEIVELVPPKATKAAKAVPSGEVAKRKLATLSGLEKRDNIRKQLDAKASQQKKQLNERSKSPRVASRSNPAAESRASQGSRIGDLSVAAEQSVTLDYIGMPAQSIKVSPYVQQMKPGISRVLQYFYDRPEIAAGRSNWGMMHAIMVYGVDTQCTVGNKRYSTIAWIAGNNICRGQRLLTQQRGRIKVKSGVGLQGHQAQMLAIFSLCDVPASYPLYAGNTKFSMQHVIEEEKLACKSGEELTFSLIGLSHYLDTDTQWIAADGQRWSCERLIREELTQPINGVACGGTHRLMGYAHALRNRRAEGKPLSGQWARAEQYVRDFVNYTYSLQNRDGSMSTNWYEGRGDNRDVDRKIQTTGHMVEFLLTATPDSQLQDPRLVRAIAFLMNSLNRDLGHEWKIGPKGHALRSLAMYHDRVFKSGPAYRRQSVAQRSPSQHSYR
jgi:hypothetical protein